MSDYPAWICADCGDKHGRWPTGHCATFHRPDPDDESDKCGWCGTWRAPLTEPRDYGYPSWTEARAEGTPQPLPLSDEPGL